MGLLKVLPGVGGLDDGLAPTLFDTANDDEVRQEFEESNCKISLLTCLANLTTLLFPKWLSIPMKKVIRALWLY